MFTDFVCPETILPLTKTAEHWLDQFYKQPVEANTVKHYTFSKRNRMGGKDIHYSFNGALVFSSLITVDRAAIHIRDGLSIGKRKLRFNFPKHIPNRINIGFALYKRDNHNNHFTVIVAQDVNEPTNSTVYWCDYLEGRIQDLFSKMSCAFVDMDEWGRIFRAA